MSYAFESIYLDDPIVTGRAIDIFRPAEVKQDISLFFVHGGGWRAGSRTCFHKIMRAFNELGYICASVDYRLAGVNLFEQITDIRHGYDLFISWLDKQSYALKPFVCGSSAGAHLSALLTLSLPGECGEELTFRNVSLRNEWIRPAGAAIQATPVTFELWEDIFPGIWTSMQGIIGAPYEGNEELYKKASPCRHISPESPPLFFLEADNEHMFPTSLVKDFIVDMKKSGATAEYKIYKNTEHGFFYDLTRWQQREAFQDILAFMSKC